MRSGLPFETLRFVAVGHVTNDRLAQGPYPGGSALYAGLSAAKLGAKVRIVTSFGSEFSGAALLSQAGVRVDRVPAERTTAFEALELDGRRSWRALSRAASLSGPIGDADVVLACPVLAEVEPSCLHPRPGRIVGAGLQGWLRRVSNGGLVEPGEPGDLAFLRGCDALFCSDEDMGTNAARVLPTLLELADMVLVTEAERGARLYWHGAPHRIRAFPTRRAVDPTGAGDAFAAVFLLALALGEPPLEAAAAAACAGSIVVEAPGPHGVNGLSELEARIATYSHASAFGLDAAGR
jgi:sugar/nucleoside kinase (ribokinase family)